MATPEPTPARKYRSRIDDMTPEERRRAIAEILARGVRRYLEGRPLPVEPPRPAKRSHPVLASDAAAPPSCDR